MGSLVQTIFGIVIALFTKLYLDMAHMPHFAYSTWCCLGGNPSKYWTGSLHLNFGNLVGIGAFFMIWL